MIKVYGINNNLNKIRDVLSDAIHDSLIEAFEYPKEKRFQKFFPMEKENFIAQNRSDNYLVIEISIFEGRSVEAKKKLIRLLFENISERIGINVQDVEITIFETPKYNWGIRGVPGDELELNYKVNV